MEEIIIALMSLSLIIGFILFIIEIITHFKIVIISVKLRTRLEIALFLSIILSLLLIVIS